MDVRSLESLVDELKAAHNAGTLKIYYRNIGKIDRKFLEAEGLRM